MLSIESGTHGELHPGVRPPPDESVSRLEASLALIDDVDRLKRDPKAQQAAIERTRVELEAVKAAT